jgi:hypothetical protein
LGNEISGGIVFFLLALLQVNDSEAVLLGSFEVVVGGLSKVEPIVDRPFPHIS